MMSLLFASEARDVVVQVVFFGCSLCCRSGYDHVLLLGHLVPLAYEAGHRPKILKRGGKVTSIALRSGIAFRDITKMLAPSTNLRKFGRLFGLEQEKAHFPFKLLTSVEVLPESPVFVGA